MGLKKAMKKIKKKGKKVGENKKKIVIRLWRILKKLRKNRLITKWQGGWKKRKNEGKKEMEIMKKIIRKKDKDVNNIKKEMKKKD